MTAAAAAAWLALGLTAAAQTFTWDGGGASGVWSDGLNWSSDTAPAAATTAALTFAGSTNTVTSNDIADLTLSGITFNNTAAAFTLGGGTATLAGNIGFSAAPTTAVTHTISMPLIVSGTRTIATQNTGGTGAAARGNVTFDGPLSGSGALVVTGNGIVTLNGVNTFAGLTAGNSAGSDAAGLRGILVIGNSQALGSGTVTALGVQWRAGTTGIVVPNAFSVAGGGLRLGGSNAMEISGNITTDTSRSFANYSGQVFTLSGGIVSGGTGGITYEGTGTSIIRITGQSSYSGTTTVSSGTLQLGGADNRLPTTAPLTVSGSGSLNLDGVSQTTSGAVQINTSGTVSGGTLSRSTGNFDLQNGTISAGLGGAAGVTKTTANTVTLSGTNSYAGVTTVSAGTLVFTRPEALYGGNTASWTAANLVASSGATVRLRVGGTGEFSGDNIGALGLGGLAAGSFLELDTTGATGDTTVAGNLSGAQTLSKAGVGTLVLSGANSYSGGTRLAAGTLALGSAGALGSSGTITFAGGTLRFSATNTTDYSARFATTASQAYRIDTDGQDVTFGTGLSSSGGTLTKLGTGTLTLGGTNSLSGTVTVSAGSLRIGNGTSGTLTGATGITFSGAGGRLILDNPSGQTLGAGLTFSNAAGGTLEVASGAVTWNPSANPSNSGSFIWTVASGASLAVGTSGGGTNIGATDGTTFTLDGAGTGTIGPSIASGGADITVIKNGSGIWTLSNTVNNWEGGTGQAGGLQINAGTIRLGASEVVPHGTNKGPVDLAAAGLLDLNGFSETINGLAGSGTVDNATTTPVVLTAGSNNVTSSFAGTISNTGGGAVGLSKIGNGTLTLSGANTYTGKTTVSAGMLAAATPAALGANPASFTADQITLNGGRLAFTGDVSSLGNRGITIGTSGGTIAPAVDTTTTLADGVITAAGPTSALTFSGQGTVVLPDASTYAGTVELGSGSSSTWDGLTGVKNGFLRLGNAQALGSGQVTSRGMQLQATVPGLVVANDIAVRAGGLRFGGSEDLELSGAVTFDSGRGIGNYSGSRKFTLSGPMTLPTSGYVNFEGSDGAAQNGTIEFAGVISGDGQVIVQQTFDNGLAILSAANTYTGTTSVNAGTLSIASPGNLGAEPVAFAAAHLTVGAGTLRTTATINGLGNRGLTLGDAATTLEQSAGTTLTLDTAVAGTGGLTKLGDGTLALTAANTFSGTTRVAAGTLALGNALALQNSTFDTQSGAVGTLSLGALSSLSLAGLTGTNAFPLANDSAAAVALTVGGTNASSSFAGALTGAGSLDKVGTGTLTLSGASSYTGTTTITAGTLAIASGDALGANPGSLAASQVILAGGRLQATAAADLGNRGLNVTAAGSVAPNTDVTLTVPTVSGTGNLALATAGTLAIAGASPGYSGTFDLGYGTASTWDGTTGTKAGFLAVGGVNALGTGPIVSRGAQLQALGPGAVLGNPIDVDNGGLRFGGGHDLELSGQISVSSGDRTFGNYSAAQQLTLSGGIALTNNRFLAFDGNSASPNGSYVVSGPISGTGRIELRTFPGGTVTLTADNTYTGTTTVTTGTLRVGAGGTTGSLPVNSATVNNAAVIFDRSDDVTYAGVISGTGTVTKAGGGTLTLTANATYTGTTTVTAGTLRLGNGGTAGIVARDIVNDGTVAFERSDTVTFSRLINGTGGLRQAGPGRLVLSGDNTYAGPTVIAAGTLDLGAGGATGGIAGDVVNDGTLRFNRTGSVSFGGTITGSGNLAHVGTGTTTLTAANSYAGATTVSAGTLVLGVAGAIPDGGAVTATGGVLDLGGATKSFASLVLTGGTISGGTVSATTADLQTGTVAADLSFGGGLSKNTAGTLTLSGTNAFTGTTTVTAGTLSIASAAALGADPGSFTAAQVTLDGGTLATTASIASLGNRGITIGAAGGTLAPAVDTTLALGGDPAGSGLLAMTGAGTLSLPPTTAFAGQFALGTGITASEFNGTVGTKAGFVLLGGSGALGGGTVLARGAQLQAATPGIVLANAFDLEGGGLRFGGSQDLEISGGIRLVSAGRGIGNYSVDKTLLLSGTLDTVDAAYAISFQGNTGVAANGTTQVSGQITGPGQVTVMSVGGRVVLANANTYAGITTVTAGTLSIASAAALGTDPAVFTAGQIVLAGGTLETTASIASFGNRGLTLGTGGGTLAPVAETTLTLTGTLTAGTNALAKAGPGTLDLGGVSRSTGAFTLAAGTLAGGTLTATSYDLQAGTVAAVLAGSGALTKSTAGTVTVTGTATRTGTTAVNAGTLRLGDGGSTGTLGGGTLTINGGGTLAVNRSGSPTITNTVTFGSGEATLAFELGGTLSGTISTLPTTGTSRLTVAAGQVLVVSGTSNIGSLGGSSVLVLDGAGTGTLQRSLASGGAAAAGIRKDGTGSWTISNTANNWSVGPLEIRQGSLLLGASNVIPHGLDATNGPKGNVVLSPDAGHTAVLDLRGFSETINGLVSSGAGTAVVDNTAAGTSTLTIGDNNTTGTFGGAIRGTVGQIAVVKTGTGTLTLSGASDYAGGTTVSAGTLRATAAGALGTGNVSVASAATLWLDASPTLGGGRAASLAAGAGLVTAGTVSLPLTSGSSLAGWRSTSDGGSTAALLAALADTATTFSTGWTANPGGFLSDILDLSGTTASGTNLMTLSMGYGDYSGDFALLNIGYRSGSSGPFTNVGTTWQGSVPYNPLTHTAAGMYGVNTGDGTIWAVTSHNSEFVVVVPEPETLVLAVLGLAAATAALGRRRRVAA